MTQYEYTLVNRDQAERLVFAQDMINEMGSQGYRLTIVSEWFFVFEREIREFSDMDYAPEVEAVDYPIDEAIDRAWIKIDNEIADRHEDE